VGVGGNARAALAAAQINKAVILAMDAEAMQVFPPPVKANRNVWMELSDVVSLETSKRRQMMGLIPASTRRNW
jgi:hypothetical protein